MKEPPGDTLGLFFYRLLEGNRSKISEKTLKNAKKSARQFYQNHRAYLVGVTGFEPATSWSRTASQCALLRVQEGVLALNYERLLLPP